MSNILEGTRIGQELEARGKAEGKAEARAAAFRSILREQFGDVPDLDDVAVALAADSDFEAAFQRLRAARSINELRA